MRTAQYPPELSTALRKINWKSAAIVGAFKEEKAFVGAFSEHCKTSRSPDDLSNIEAGLGLCKL